MSVRPTFIDIDSLSKTTLLRSEDGRRDVSNRESIPRMADDRIAELLTHGGSLLADSRGGSVPANCQLRY